MKKNIKGFTAAVLTGIMVMAGSMMVQAAEKVCFYLPIDYFCMEEDETESTQEQLDENSKDGLRYEFSDDGQIACIVEDQDTALKAVLENLEEDFKDFQDSDGFMYTSSFKKLDYNEDLSNITITCSKDDWNEYDGWYSMLFIASARDYQRILGIEEDDLKCDVVFVDENGEVLYSDNFENYK